MRIFLLRAHGTERPDEPAAADTLARLIALYQPLFSEPLETRVHKAAHADLVLAELPVKGWLPPSFQQDEQTWAFAPDFPINARSALREAGLAAPPGEDVLPTLARALQADPEPLLRHLVPPFSLIWGGTGDDPAGGEIHVQNDGLGQAPLYVHDGPGGWVLTNHSGALKAQGLALEPVAEEWAARFVIGWFPLDMTGLRHVRNVEPATHYTLGAGGVTTSRCDVLTGWVQPDPMSPRDCKELALHSMRSLVADMLPQWERPTAGLTGGWDSRAVVACLRDAGANVSYRVRGHAERMDVLIAHHLAHIAGIKLRIKTKGAMPAPDLDSCRRSMKGALLWQMGNMPTKRHKMLLAKKPQLGRGLVNVMGQHAGLGKADFIMDTKALDLDPSRYEDALVEFTLAGAPGFLRQDRLASVEDIVRQSYRAAERFGLDGLAPLNFYYLYEFTRRWGSATVNAQTGMVFAPWLNPGMIRACYAYPQREIAERPFHKHITRTLAPEWADIVYENEASEDDIRSGRIPALPEGAVRSRKSEQVPAWQAQGRYRKFHDRTYWMEMGKPLAKEALDADGFWRELFDPAVATTEWKYHPDDLVLAYLLPEVLENGGF